MEEATCGKVKEIRVWATVLAVEMQVEKLDMHHHVVGVVGRLVCQLGISKITTLTSTDPKRQFGSRRHPSITPQEGTRTAIEALAWRHVAGKQMLMRGARNVSPLACIRWHPSGYPLDPKGTYLVRLAQHESRRWAAILREARAGLQHRQPGETSNTKHKAQSTKHKAQSTKHKAQSGMQKPVRTRRGRARARRPHHRMIQSVGVNPLLSQGLERHGRSGTSKLGTWLSTAPAIVHRPRQALMMGDRMGDQMASASSETDGKAVPQVPLRRQPPRSQSQPRSSIATLHRGVHNWGLLIPAAERKRREGRDGRLEPITSAAS
jgi:hypothetical protein